MRVREAAMTLNRTGNPYYLLTPGPLSTSRATKQAMLRDWGSWDADFRAITARVGRRLIELADGGDDYICVPMQGSGSFAVEAAIGTLLPRDGRLLVPVNGAYCRRIVESCRYMGRAVTALDGPEDRVPDLAALEQALRQDAAITHVAAVHCETTSGIRNPLEAIAALAAAHGRGLIVDAISSFGALPVAARALRADAITISANKCIEGVPGIGFVLCRRAALERAAGNAHSLCLDLHAQGTYLEKTGQFRYTPPTHVMAAFDAALDQHAREGGTAARGARYAENCRVLVDGMRALGFRTLLDDSVQSPIIVTFHSPADTRYRFDAFYEELKRRGFVIYPGKVTVADTFRIGCIGQVGPAEMRELVAAVAASLAALGVADGRPALAA